jgi:hypothetical protein
MQDELQALIWGAGKLMETICEWSFLIRRWCFFLRIGGPKFVVSSCFKPVLASNPDGFPDLKVSHGSKPLMSTTLVSSFHSLWDFVSSLL